MKTLQAVAVFCGSRLGQHTEYREAAAELGKLLGERRIDMVYGGASVGLMGALADSILEQGGEVTGVITEGLKDKELAHSGLSKLCVVGSMHARKAMMDVIEKVDFFLPSNPTDCQILFGTDDPYKVIEASNNLGVPNTIVTCGESGAIISVNGETFHQPAYKPELAISSTGAGDAFSGAFLSAYLTGMSPKDSAKIASIASGLKVRGRGALTTMPSQDDVMKIFKETPFDA